VSGEADTMIGSAVRRRLTAAWWLIMPPFALLVLRLGSERACAAPYELLPAATSIPAVAWLLAALYVAAHGWLFAAWLGTAIEADALVPPLRTVRQIWGRQTWMVVATAAIFVVEYWPVPLWRALGRHVFGCGP
jgi:hypothetical protein